MNENVIKIVKGDHRPRIKLTLTNDLGEAIDLSSATVSVLVNFRSVNSEVALTSVTATKDGDGSTGIVTFAFPATSGAVQPGYYDGAVEVLFDGERQTVYDKLKFFVRDPI